MRSRRAVPILQQKEFCEAAGEEGAWVEIECITAPDPDARYRGEWVAYVVDGSGYRFLLVNTQSKERVFNRLEGLVGFASATLHRPSINVPFEAGAIASSQRDATKPELPPHNCIPIREFEMAEAVRNGGASVEVECLAAPEFDRRIRGEWQFYAVLDGVRHVLVTRASTEKTHTTLEGVISLCLSRLQLPGVQLPLRLGFMCAGMRPRSR